MTSFPVELLTAENLEGSRRLLPLYERELGELLLACGTEAWWRWRGITAPAKHPWP